MPKNKLKSKNKICYIEEYIDDDIDDSIDYEFIKIFILFNEFQLNIKLYYLLTTKYKIYKNIDNLYNDFVLLSNNFFDQYKIIFKNKIPLNIENLKINISYNSEESNNNLIEIINIFKKNINIYLTILNSNSNLHEVNIITNILSNIIVLINKFLYIINLD